MRIDPTLRPATPSDTEALIDVWRRAVEATHRFLSPADIAGLERLIREVYLGAVDVTVAESDGAVRGFVGTSGGAGRGDAGRGDADPLSIEMLFVDPSVHGRGLGTALLEDAAGGAPGVLVDVNEQNPDALAFYLSRGFQRVGRSETDGEGRPFPLVHLRRP